VSVRRDAWSTRVLRRLLGTVPESIYDAEGLPPEPDLHIRYLGTAGFVFTGGQRTIVVDPFVSRPGLRATALGPMVPDEALISELIPRADDVLIGHAHYDHVLDGPTLCHQTGARLIGSPATMQVGRAAGLPEAQLLETRGRERILCGDAVVQGLPSAHGRVYFNRVTLPGDITTPPSWPPRLRELRHGLVLNWWLEMAGIRVVHIDSAEFFTEELAGLEADVVCLCAIGRRYRPRYVEECVELLRPKLIIPCHWDLFMTPWGTEPALLPGVDLPGFIEEIEATGVQARVPRMGGELGLMAAQLRS